MITYVTGILTEKNPAYAIIECGGIGYMLNISVNTYSALGELNTKQKLLSYLAIKNEATTPVGMVMYGFATEDERELFVNLISVSGVGSNTARLILSSLITDEVISAIVNGDVNTFQKVKGIGTKTAQKIIIDLRDKFNKWQPSKQILSPGHNRKREEALSALKMLGFPAKAAESAVEKILKTEDPSLTVEGLIKMSLKIL
jgi:Holliday junction DNA helicase RuvA